jgi:hypothetical protein
MPRPRKPASPFRCFNSSPEVIRLVMLMYVRVRHRHLPWDGKAVVEQVRPTLRG